MTQTIKQLRQRKRELMLRREVAELEAWSESQQSAERSVLESYWTDPSNFVDLRDYYGNEYALTPLSNPGGLNTLADRAEGRNWPVYYTENELALLRGVSRALFEANPMAKGALNTLTNYVIGTGFKHTATSRGNLNKDLAAKVQGVIDEFIEENKWSGVRDRETFKRNRRDGESGVSLWDVGGGHTQVRCVEPVSIVEPSAKAEIEAWLGAGPGSWTFGVHTDRDDVESIHGYYVQWTSDPGDWDYLPGGNSPTTNELPYWMVHTKINTDSNVKRGLPDAFAINKNFELARKLLRNVGEGSSVQSAIAFFREHAAGVTGDKIRQFIRNGAFRSQQRAGDTANKTSYSQEMTPGTIVDHGAGTQYKYGPLGNNNAPVFLDVCLALLQSCGVIWAMPSYMITGNGENGAYASALVAESPFTKACEVKQQEHTNTETEILWKAIWFAWRAGRFGEITWVELRATIKLTISPPDVAVRDRAKETDRRLKLVAVGGLSLATAVSEEGYDLEQERNKGAAPMNVPETGGNVTGSPDTPRGTDETKHPLMKGQEVKESVQERIARVAESAWREYP